MDVAIRAAGSDDEAFLREMQYLALFVPPGAEPLPRAIVDDPAIAAQIVAWFDGHLPRG